jgi:hypothetical protein
VNRKMTMKRHVNKILFAAVLACTFFWCAVPTHAQCTLASTGVGGGCGSGATTVTVNLGPTIANTAYIDNGNALLPFANQFTTPTPSSGSITVTALGSFISSPAAANWGLAIYTDSSGAPGSLVSGCSTFSSSTPSTGANTLAPGTCTLSGATNYWIAFVTASNTQNQLLTTGSTSTTTCPNSSFGTSFVNSPIASFTSAVSWPSTWPSATGGQPCHPNYVTLQYNTTATYTIISSGMAECTMGNVTCTFDIAPTGGGHGLIVGTGLVDIAGTFSLSSVTDSASDTISARGSCSSHITSNNLAMCFASTDRVTSGATSLTLNGSISSGCLIHIAFAEVEGTAASSSFDKSDYDTSTQSSPFTSGNTATTTQANEILFGLAVNGTGSSGVFTAGGSWTLIEQLDDTVAQTTALFMKAVSSTGAYNLSGSYNSTGGNLPALATFK